MPQAMGGGRLASLLLVVFFAGPKAWALHSEGKPTAESSRYRMSEEALNALVGVAELRLGIGVFRYEKDETGRYVPTYESSVCPIRGASRLQALFAAGRRDVELELLRLRPLADVDGSGFISTEEGVSVAGLVDFGFRLQAAVREEGPSGERVARLMGLQREELRSRLSEYQVVVARGRQVGIVLTATPRLDWNER